MKNTRDKKQLNRKEGMVMVKEAHAPPATVDAVKSPHQEAWDA